MRRYDVVRDARRKPNRSSDCFLEHKYAFMFHDHLTDCRDIRDRGDTYAVFPYDQKMTGKHHKVEKGAKLEGWRSVDKPRW